MNGRVYDPVIGRFLSPDPIVQMPDNLQSLNRYSYCLNNPLSLTDPSGYSWLSNNWKTLVTAAVAITVTVYTAGTAAPAAWGAVGAAAAGGAAGGFAGGVVGTLLNGGDMGQALKAGLVGAAIGGISGAFTAGIGDSFVNVKGFWGAMAKASLHGGIGGIRSVAQGGKFEHGFYAASLSSLGGSASTAIGDKINDTGHVIIGAVIGGTAEEIGGGKFANGAITGAYTVMLNDRLHEGNRGEINKASIALANAINSMPLVMVNVPMPIFNPLYGAGAVAIDGGINFVGSEVDGGIILMLRGKDAGRYVPYFERAGGGGTGASVGIDVVRYDYSGGNDNIRIDMLEGFRHKVYAGGTLYGVLGAGGGVAWSILGLKFVVGTTVSAGVGMCPLPVDAGYNQGDVKFK